MKNRKVIKCLIKIINLGAINGPVGRNAFRSFQNSRSLIFRSWQILLLSIFYLLLFLFCCLASKLIELDNISESSSPAAWWPTRRTGTSSSWRPRWSPTPTFRSRGSSAFFLLRTTLSISNYFFSTRQLGTVGNRQKTTKCHKSPGFRKCPRVGGRGARGVGGLHYLSESMTMLPLYKIRVFLKTLLGYSNLNNVDRQATFIGTFQHLYFWNRLSNIVIVYFNAHYFQAVRSAP